MPSLPATVKKSVPPASVRFEGTEAVEIELKSSIIEVSAAVPSDTQSWVLAPERPTRQPP